VAVVVAQDQLLALVVLGVVETEQLVDLEIMEL
jgi:hypothetical protein